jgi:hypothetical protein
MAALTQSHRNSNPFWSASHGAAGCVPGAKAGQIDLVIMDVTPEL